MPPLRCQQIAWDNPLEHAHSPETISDYRQCVIDTFKFWINVHTKPDWWVAQMVLGMCNDDECTAKALYERGEKYWKYTFSREWYEFDWEEAIQDIVVRDMLKEGKLSECSRCSELVITGINDELDCPSVWEETEEEGPHTCVKLIPFVYRGQSDFDNLVQQVVYHLDQWQDSLGNVATEEQLLQAARKGFYWYFTGVRPRIKEHYREMRERINILTNTEGKSREDQLLDIQRTTDVRHTKGEVLADYMDSIGVFMDISDVVRNQGLAAAFGQEAVLRFLEGGE